MTTTRKTTVWVIEDNHKLRRDLAETEDLLRSAGAQSQSDKPEIAERAVDALRTLQSERVDDRVRESEEMLQEQLEAHGQ